MSKTCTEFPAWMKDLPINDKARAILVEEEIDEENFLLFEESDLKDLGIAAGPRKSLAKEIALRASKRRRLEIVIPQIPSCRSSGNFYERAAALEGIRGYVKAVVQNEWKADKVPLLGSSGVKGIGKTEILTQVAQNLVPPIAKELNMQMTPIFITFNGGGAANTNCFSRHLETHQSITGQLSRV